jgi:hypothetical protein
MDLFSVAQVSLGYEAGVGDTRGPIKSGSRSLPLMSPVRTFERTSLPPPTHPFRVVHYQRICY